MVTPTSASPAPDHSQRPGSEDSRNKISQTAQSIIQQSQLSQQPQLITSDQTAIHVGQETIVYEKMIASPDLLNEWVQSGDDTSIKSPDYRKELFRKYALKKQPLQPDQIKLMSQLPRQKLKELLQAYATYAPNKLPAGLLANDVEMLKEITVAMVIARHSKCKEGLSNLEPHFIKNRDVAISILKECAQKAPVVDLMSYFSVQNEQDRLAILLENCKVAPDVVANSLLPVSTLSSKALHELAVNLCRVRLADRITTEPQREVLEKVLSQAKRCGNAPLVWKLLNQFTHSFDEINQVYGELIQNQGTILTHLALPMIPIACWVKEALSANVSDPEKLKSNLINLRDLLRNIASNSPMVNLLEVMMLVNGDPTIPADRKITLMEEITGGITKKDATVLTDRLRAVSILIASMSTEILEQPLGENCHILSESILDSLTKNDYFDLQEIDHLTEKYLATFGSTRIPNLVQLYAQDLQMNKYEQYKEAFNLFVKSVLEDRFYQVRNSQNQIHSDKISSHRPELWKSWIAEQPPKIINPNKDRPFYCYDTADWRETLLCANEVGGSCLAISGAGENARNVGLLGLLLDPKNRMFTIKDDTGKIACRMIARLLWNETKNAPALFIEKIYGKFDPTLRQCLTDFAQERAKELQVDLFTKTEQYGEPTQDVLQSYGTYPAEYVDAINGVTFDKFTIKTPRLMTSG